MILQKAITPQQLAGYSRRGVDTVAGYVVDAADAARRAHGVTDLFALHGLGFPGSPFRADAPFLDVLRFTAVELMHIEPAIGGRTREEARQRSGPFVDRAPFTGTGFANWAGPPAPLWFLDQSRLPPGSELWRVHADSREELVAVYLDVGHGWSGVSNGLVPVSVEGPSIPSLVAGAVATWQDISWPADILGDGRTVALASLGEPPMGGFVRTNRQWWRREVPLDDVGEFYDLWLTARWHEQPFRIMNRWEDDGRTMAELFYLGRDADTAESMRLIKFDAGVYGAFAPVDELTDVQGAQRTPSTLAAHAPA